MAVLDSKLYAVGGENDNDGVLGSVERYEPAANAWEAVAAMGEGRNRPGAAVLEGKLYAVGGCDDNVGSLSSVERYDPALNAWESVAPMSEARCDHAMAVLDGKLYAVGGWNGGYLSSVERYDPSLRMRGRRWRRWRRRGRLMPWRRSTASCTLWAGTAALASMAALPAARLSDTIPRRTRGRRLRRWRPHDFFMPSPWRRVLWRVEGREASKD